MYRGTPRAYATDAAAHAEARPAARGEPAARGAHQSLSVILVFIHSEDAADLATVHELLERVRDTMAGRFPAVWGALQGIAANHAMRMQLFGRIPERNAILGRSSTPAELAYTAALWTQHSTVPGPGRHGAALPVTLAGTGSRLSASRRHAGAAPGVLKGTTSWWPPA